MQIIVFADPKDMSALSVQQPGIVEPKRGPLSSKN